MMPLTNMITIQRTIRKSGAFALIACLTGVLLSSASAQNAQNEKRIENNRERFQKRQSKGVGHAIPSYIMARAKGIVIINRVKTGAGIGVSLGNGVAMVRKADGNWSPPAFVLLTKGSLGSQMGAEQSTIIALLMTDDSLNSLKQGVKISGGATLQAAAGPVDVGKDITNVSIKKPILVYTDSKGAFAGATLTAGWVNGDRRRNKSHYKLSMQEVLFSNEAEYTRAARSLIKTINLHSNSL